MYLLSNVFKVKKKKKEVLHTEIRWRFNVSKNVQCYDYKMLILIHETTFESIGGTSNCSLMYLKPKSKVLPKPIKNVVE